MDLPTVRRSGGTPRQTLRGERRSYEGALDAGAAVFDGELWRPEGVPMSPWPVQKPHPPP